MFRSICATVVSLTIGVMILLAEREPADAAVDAPQPTVLYLEVVVNGTKTGKIAEFLEDSGGSLAINREDWRQLGLPDDDLRKVTNGLMTFDELSWLSYEYDRVAQTVHIHIAHDHLPTYVIDGQRRGGGIAPGDAQSDRGAVLNYALHGTIDDGGESMLGAELEARAFGHHGNFTQSAALKLGGAGEAVRLNTTWTSSNPRSLITWRGGDIISGGLAWTRPVRLGGLQLQRNFGLRSDLITMPLPEFSGSAAVPSTVDVYANNARLVSEDVPAGPFSVTNLPIVTGAGTATIIVRDASGRTVETSRPFYASSALLRKGLTDFSMEAGFPRRSFGTRSVDYSDDFAFSASMRRGLSDRLTLEAHAELSAALLNGGVGVVMPIARYGLADFAVAGSTGESTGGLASLGLTLDFGRIGLRLRTSRTFGEYTDIAAISASSTASDSNSIDTGYPRAIDQIGLSMPVSAIAGSAMLSFARVTAADGDDDIVASLSYSLRMPDDATLYVQGFRSFDSDSDSGLYVGYSRQLDGGMSASIDGNYSADDAGGRVQVAKSGGHGAGAYAWRLAGGVGENYDILGSANYQSRLARFGMRLRGSEHGTFASAEMTGAIAAIDGGLYMTDRIDDAFAVVDVGAPNVTVYSENRAIGRSNRNGKIIVTGLRSWESNRLSIDPADMPLDVEPESTELAIVPKAGAGVIAAFGATSTSHSAIIVLRHPTGDFLAPGTPVRLATGEEAIVGYDGQTFFLTLGPSNKLTATLDPSVECQATFDFLPSDEIQPVIENVVCG